MLAHDAFFTEDKVLSKTLIKKHQCEIFVSRCYASEAYVVMRCLCVCVCPSRSCILSKRISLKFFHHRVDKPFYFFYTKRHGNIPTGTPLTGASNAAGVGKPRF